MEKSSPQAQQSTGLPNDDIQSLNKAISSLIREIQRLCRTRDHFRRQRQASIKSLIEVKKQNDWNIGIDIGSPIEVEAGQKILSREKKQEGVAVEIREKLDALQGILLRMSTLMVREQMRNDGLFVASSEEVMWAAELVPAPLKLRGQSTATCGAGDATIRNGLFSKDSAWKPLERLEKDVMELRLSDGEGTFLASQ
ncbi:hypothetical protein BGW36DRAFT_426189 [Talaromyces proteolyticus]|uniref:Uncharacterized protein n=1 Tax=Talaromyces proteolyticus TaxID=1131652 RepID=A0AAD4KWH7_9EURO|nr:uncharacterized protein BGW36DRAFT_426189 [Talaromyces proteolyticus]KAH8698482.1 hypothetical protein BGW36DRAFT_426189 [Talaromyces proteolyticus]